MATHWEKAASIQSEGVNSSASGRNGGVEKAEKADGDAEAPDISAPPNAKEESDKKNDEATAEPVTNDAEGPGTRP